MGAWGCGPFDNDCAMDFVGELADGPAGQVAAELRSAMEEVVAGDEYVDSSEMSAALAAACLVAARLDPSIPLNVSVKKYLDGMTFEVDERLRDLAARVFARNADPGDNELHDLWADADGLADVEKANAPFRRAVTGTG